MVRLDAPRGLDGSPLEMNEHKERVPHVGLGRILPSKDLSRRFRWNQIRLFGRRVHNGLGRNRPQLSPFERPSRVRVLWRGSMDMLVPSRSSMVVVTVRFLGQIVGRSGVEPGCERQE